MGSVLALGRGVLSRSIHDMSFGASPITAHVADSIEWTNDDFVAHTVTARDGSFDVTIPPGKTGRTTLAKAGKRRSSAAFTRR